MICVGLSYGYHNSCATLIVDGNLIASPEKERFCQHQFSLHKTKFLSSLYKLYDVLSNELSELNRKETLNLVDFNTIFKSTNQNKEIF